ncbi:hypothetical protein U8C35_06570 [Sinorhizobium medicae]|uniref:hypothetical protein n=1 Tax=Sinorhizobium medicae TaxID=110321 RepID=UPI002AF6BA59|nr:hypothetical protein [Sinorhizobium medicae]WQO60097.1 hypothetical protein U8C35_06570 [Sinorhizobium medicae]
MGRPPIDRSIVGHKEGMNLKLSQAQRERLKQMAAQHGISATETISRAIDLYEQFQGVPPTAALLRLARNGIVDTIPDFYSHDFSDLMVSDEPVTLILPDLGAFLAGPHNLALMAARLAMDRPTNLILSATHVPNTTDAYRVSDDGQHALGLLFDKVGKKVLREKHQSLARYRQNGGAPLRFRLLSVPASTMNYVVLFHIKDVISVASFAFPMTTQLPAMVYAPSVRPIEAKHFSNVVRDEQYRALLTLRSPSSDFHSYYDLLRSVLLKDGLHIDIFEQYLGLYLGFPIVNSRR